MKVSDIITYITKIMEFDFKKIRSSSFRNKQKSVKKLKKVNKIAFRQVVRKQVGLQDRKNENTPNFPSTEIWY